MQSSNRTPVLFAFYDPPPINTKNSSDASFDANTDANDIVYPLISIQFNFMWAGRARIKNNNLFLEIEAEVKILLNSPACS